MAFVVVLIEIKLNSTEKRKSLYGLETLIADTGADYGLVINTAKRVELLTDKIVQLPVNYI